jgi:hypothetical protein
VQATLFGVEQAERTSDDYYTPPWIFDRLALDFDLDVCAPPGGIPWIPAVRHFTKEDDGLAQPWHGRVWMNPPFSLPEPWVDRFITHRNGVCLVPMSNGRWFHRLWGEADGITLPVANAIQFIGGGIPIRCALVAFGPENVAALGLLGRVR